MLPIMYDSTSVSCGATCSPLEDNQCAVQGNGLFANGISKMGFNTIDFNLRLAVHST